MRDPRDASWLATALSFSGFLRSAPLYIWNCIFRTWPPHVSVKSWFKNWNCKNTMWQIVNIASPSPLLHLTDKGIEQIGQFLCFFPHLLVLLPLEQFLCFFLSGDMSTSSSAPRSTWPVYGPVPMTRCTDCPRTVPLKRLTLKEEKNGNFGREFVKCESKPEGQVRSEFSSHPLSLISQKICQIWI